MRYLIGLFACLSLLVPGSVSGQTVGATTGAINGKVVDQSDAVLPGVTVTITAPQMQGEQTAVTNAEGNYRFEGMPRLGGAAGGPAEMQMLAVEIFKTTPGSGAITACTDLGKQLGDLKLYADLRQDLEPIRSVGPPGNMTTRP